MVRLAHYGEVTLLKQQELCSSSLQPVTVQTGGNKICQPAHLKLSHKQMLICSLSCVLTMLNLWKMIND